jgi:hypothetical protein
MTCKEDTSKKWVQKKLQSTDTLECVTTPPVVSHTQDVTTPTIYPHPHQMMSLLLLLLPLLQLTYESGTGVSLHFPTYDRKYDIELKFTIILFELQTFQVWETRKLGNEFHKKLFRLKKEQNHEALYCCYLVEIYGDPNHTMYLLAHYKIYEMKTMAIEKKNTPGVTPSPVPTAEDPYPSLSIGGDIYNAFVQHGTSSTQTINKQLFAINQSIKSSQRNFLFKMD